LLVGAKMVHVALAGMVSPAACRGMRDTQQAHRPTVSAVASVSGVAMLHYWRLRPRLFQAQQQQDAWHLNCQLNSHGTAANEVHLSRT
jgi:hypothetical protein